MATSSPNSTRRRVREIAGRLREKGIRSVAVCLLHAYKYPQHEQRIAALLREEDPDIFVSLSSEVCPEVREFDRASTTVVNAYTRPQMAAHVAHLQREFANRGIDRQVLWMTSSGGLVPSRRAAELPVRLIESGPAAGAVAAAEFGRIAGEAKRAVVRHGRHDRKALPDPERRADRRHRPRSRALPALPEGLRLPAQDPVDPDDRDRRGRRLHRGEEPARPARCRSALGRRAAGPGRLPARRHRADGHRCRHPARLYGRRILRRRLVQGLEGCGPRGDGKARGLAGRQRRTLRLGHPRPRQRIHEQGGGHARDRPRRRSPRAADGGVRRRRPGACLRHRAQARHQAHHLPDRAPGSHRRSGSSSRRSRWTCPPAFPMGVDNWDFDHDAAVARRSGRSRGRGRQLPPASRRRRSPTVTRSTCVMSGRGTRSRSRCPTAVCRRTNFSSSSSTTSPSSIASCSAAP